MTDVRIDEFNQWAERDGWTTRADGDLAFRSAKLQEAHAVWREACAGRTLAARADMTPRVMKNFLSNIVIWDVLRGGDAVRFRVRVMGTPLQRIWRGKAGDFIDEVVPEPYRSRWHRIAQLSLSLRAPLRCHGCVQFANQTYLNSETFQAPLAQEGEEPDAILFVHVVEPKAFRPSAPLAAAEAR
jgi:hypothetical protein